MKKELIRKLPTDYYLHLLRFYSYIRYNKVYKHNQFKKKNISVNGYTYKPFVETQSIFVHIPKCAGISVTQALYGNMAGGHTTLDQYLRVFTAGEISRYFKFTIVRNPWDRVVSAYLFLKRGGMNDVDKNFYEVQIAKFLTFEHFVKSWLNMENIHCHYHFLPQSYFILDRYEKVKLDYIGRLETINKDFNHIANRLGISKPLQNMNRSKRENYRSYYTDETREIVTDVYARDIELLGYEY